MLVAYDLDGVLATEPWYQPLLFKVHPGFALSLRDKAKPHYRPVGNAAKLGLVITGRPSVDYKRTTDWLAKNDLNMVLCTRPPFRDAVTHKAMMCNLHEVDVFIESCKHQAAAISKACNSTRVISPQEAVELNLIEKV